MMKIPVKSLCLGITDIVAPTDMYRYRFGRLCYIFGKLLGFFR